MPRKPTPERKSRSGPTQSQAARRNAGRTRVDVWLPDDLVERLDAHRGERSRREAVEGALRLVLQGSR